MELVKAGLSPAEALQSATILPARFLEADDQYGSIEKGKFANFIVLSENPLVTISNTKTIEKVISERYFYEEQEIAYLKKYVERESSAFGLTSKLLYRLVTSIFG